MTMLLDVKNISKRFTVSRGMGGSPGTVHAVDDVSFSIAPGETLGLVGESGCGKSTVGKMIVRLLEPNEGEILLEGTDITHASHRAMRPLRRRVQMIFQDPNGSLDPRQRAADIVEEPLVVHGLGNAAERKAKVADLFARVGLRPDQMGNVPSKFSGGQRQRLAIARALALNPSLIVADEPVSALDVSIQAQVVNLMSDIQKEFGLAYLFVAHDLGVVQHISDRVAVMYLGRIVEIGDTAAVYQRPSHPYTRTLMEAVPRPDPTRRHSRIKVPRGEVPSPLDPPSGCTFHPRCPIATEVCRAERPRLRRVASGAEAACHHAD
ncbi:ABC transporter ATP-binding protein [Mesorhizobium australicum]|uniref:Peptide/nickel transport system ATP-binding protein n=1 Tax=Mesorhizobium australicum TaxID=536018 RepID=A0A1X7MTG3_9HYPH|nr:dipeptide ABC transporter ATP-binding protein [Mesorhizobium australicum]SMH28119.1 peptide/nickel transport system ATP-binding protein [Mesorhizobium australicum]